MKNTLRDIIFRNNYAPQYHPCYLVGEGEEVGIANKAIDTMIIDVALPISPRSEKQARNKLDALLRMTTDEKLKLALTDYQERKARLLR